jgi:hypothetical protein
MNRLTPLREIIVWNVSAEYQDYVDKGIGKPVRLGDRFRDGALASRHIGFPEGSNQVAQALSRAKRADPNHPMAETRGVTWVKICDIGLEEADRLTENARKMAEGDPDWGTAAWRKRRPITPLH